MALKRIISYMKQVASPALMHDTGCLGLVHWDDPEGWYDTGGRRERVGRVGRMALKRIISCMKRVTSPGSMHDAGCLRLVHWEDPEGWNGYLMERTILCSQRLSKARP